MYVVTFYSFKGGTGRSMALANVAADLLSRGRRVLIVDFDLEAPGLDTFPMKLDRPVRRGLVEMINDYLSSPSEATPLIDDYVYSAQLAGVSDGVLWLMPAGCQDASYDSRFRDIDWQDFYENEGGFLFFEDLKAQWLQSLNPDYVLIDSRTGHTDIGGICTRQLPDCVVAMFSPNEQNLRGLVPVIQEVRAEEEGPLQKRIGLHFVMGNVPDLDDEDEIFSNAASLAEKLLGYEQLAATIHHFNSWSMLEQRLLLVERPRSKIATEYKQLTSAIVQQNLQDRDGAISVIERALFDLRSGGEAVASNSLEKSLQSIRTLHSNDRGVLGQLAKFRRAQRRTDESLDLFEQILQLDESDPESLVGRAEVFTSAGKTSAALGDLMSFFSLSYVSPFSFALATRLLMANDRSQMSVMLDSPAMPRLPVNSVLDLLHDFQRSYETTEFGAVFLRRWTAAHHGDETWHMVTYDLSLCLIAAGHFEEAEREIDKLSKIPYLELGTSFNYAMAEWGRRGMAPVPLFQEVISRITNSEEDLDPNRLQCYSLAFWGAGDKARAVELFDRTVAQFAIAPRSVFSAWSYLYRSPKGFRADLNEMSAMYSSGFGKPSFIRDSADLFPGPSLQ